MGREFRRGWRQVLPREIVAGLSEAAFAVDMAGRIVAWNDACARLLGYAAGSVRGRACCDVICGQDVHGNRYCLTSCAARELARQGKPVRSFPLDLPTASGATVRVRIALEALATRGRAGGIILHRLRPVMGGPEGGSRPPARDGAGGRGSGCHLSRRELQVLQLLADGADARGVAEELFISLSTARTHIQHILTKLGAHSQAQAVALAVRGGLV